MTDERAAPTDVPEGFARMDIAALVSNIQRRLDLRREVDRLHAALVSGEIDIEQFVRSVKRLT